MLITSHNCGAALLSPDIIQKSLCLRDERSSSQTALWTSQQSLYWGRCSWNLFFFLPPPDISSENFGTSAGEFIHKVQSVSRTWHGEPFYLKYWCALELLPPLHFQNQSHFCRYHIQEKLLSKALDQLLIHDRKLFIIKGTVREAGAAQAQREYGASAGWLLKSMSGGTDVCQRSSSFVFIICLNTKNS